MDHFLTVEFLGVFVLAVIASGIVSLFAVRKSIGYGKAFLLSFTLSIILILVRIPFPIWIAAGMSAGLFLVWPKRNAAAEAKN